MKSIAAQIKGKICRVCAAPRLAWSSGNTLGRRFVTALHKRMQRLRA